MKKYVFLINKIASKIERHEFSNASFWVFISNSLQNFGSFLFIFLLARILKPDEYSTSITLISIMNLIMVPTAIIQLILISTLSEVRGQRSAKKVSALIHLFLKLILKISAVLTLVSVLFLRNIANFIHLDNKVYLLIILLI